MHLPTLTSLVLLPLLAVAQSSSTTTLTSTATMTKTITVSEVVASVTSTFAAYNSTMSTGPTGTGASQITSSPSAKATNTAPANFMGAASNLNGAYAGGVGIVVMIAAALL